MARTLQQAVFEHKRYSSEQKPAGSSLSMQKLSASKTKSPAGQRTIRLDDETAALLKQHKKDQAVKSFLVLQENGRILKYSSVAKALDRALKSAGLAILCQRYPDRNVITIL